MSTQMYDGLKECAVFNIEKLFHIWGVTYTKISEYEYDFLNPTRDDKNFGACRFNTFKGIGGDFTGASFTDKDFSNLSGNLDISDFAGINASNKYNWGFDIIGLKQRICNFNTYREAAKALKEDIDTLKILGEVTIPSQKHILDKQRRQEEHKLKSIQFAMRAWKYCIDYRGTPGQGYLENRKLFMTTLEPSIRFHHKILCKETNGVLPALVFKISSTPDGELTGVHRVYIDPFKYTKANVKNAKMALGEVMGNAIWFGEPCETLCIAEGPENALAVLVMGFKFVASTVNAANLSCLTIPPYVTKIVIFADNDKPGLTNAVKAKETYKVPVIVKIPKKGDWNDVLIEAYDAKRERH